MQKNRSVLFIGANDMAEIENYIDRFDSGVFIEPIPAVYEKLCENLAACNQKHGTDYRAVCALISDKHETVTFNIISGNAAHKSRCLSSSICEINPAAKATFKQSSTLQLEAKLGPSILQEHGIESANLMNLF